MGGGGGAEGLKHGYEAREELVLLTLASTVAAAAGQYPPAHHCISSQAWVVLPSQPRRALLLLL